MCFLDAISLFLSSCNEYFFSYFIILQPGLPHHTNVSPGLWRAAKDSQKAHSPALTPVSSRCKRTAHLKSQSPEGCEDGGPRCHHCPRCHGTRYPLESGSHMPRNHTVKSSASSENSIRQELMPAPSLPILAPPYFTNAIFKFFFWTSERTRAAQRRLARRGEGR